MFGYNKKKKLRNKVIAAAAGVAVMTFGIWLNYSDNDKNTAEETVQKIEIEEETKIDESKTDGEKLEDSDDKTYETYTENADKSYLVKEDEGVVKVYLCEGSNRELYLITSIPYDILSETDQKMLTEGVSLDSDEDLGKFLENFDS